MAFNPRDHKPMKEKALFNLPKNGKPGVVISPLQRIRNDAALELRFDKKPLKPASELEMTKGPRLEYYIEWWKVGTDHKEIETGYFHSANIRNFVKCLLSGQKYTLVYLRREKDQAVMKDARSTAGR